MPVLSNRHILHLFLLFVFANSTVFAQRDGRAMVLFDDGWQFAKGEQKGAESPKFNDGSWRTVDLPHDWSIENLPEINYKKRTVLDVVRDVWLFKEGDNQAYRSPNYYDGTWEEVNLPLTWDVHSNYTADDAYGWYRKKIVISNKYKSDEFYINFGKIADVDQIYLNGELIGSSGSFPPLFSSAVRQNRQYRIPKKLVNYGKENTIAIRVYSKNRGGGIYSVGEQQLVSGAYDSHSEGGRSTGFTRGGIGWYRKTFKLLPEYKGKKIQMLFEGVYKDASIWINGHLLSRHHNGYASFWRDLTPYINYGGKNTLVLKVENIGSTSRYYSGSGIYRHVWMVVSKKIHVDNWGVRIDTESIDENSATVNVVARVKSDRTDTINVRFRTEIMGPDDKQVLFDVQERRVLASSVSTVNQNFVIEFPQLWSPASPSLYTAISTININGELLDWVETPFGIRKINVDTVNGFQINNEPILLHGGNVHHDNGVLGARSFDDAEERKVKLLLDAGYNAVRCANNPPSSAFLRACDKLGMLVINELFDSWKALKPSIDYNRDFVDHWREDLQGMIQRDWNHPSVIMWSVGNDVPERFSPEGLKLVKELSGFARTLDRSRPITSPVSGSEENWEAADKFFAPLDVASLNYTIDEYETAHDRQPNRVYLNSEIYPSHIYDAQQQTRNLPFVMGDFVWSAMDYLGEAGKGWYSFKNEPYELFPWTTAYCGDLDLLGDKRPQWYYRQTVLNKRPQAYIFVKPPRLAYKERTTIDWGWEEVERSWSWPGFDMVFFEVHVYSNCDRVKLYQNGRVLAEKVIKPEDKNIAVFYVPYSDGSLKVIGFMGKRPLVQDVLPTLGVPIKIALKADKDTLIADGQSLMFLEVEARDANDQLHPMATAPLEFSIKGPAQIIAIGNANPQNIDGMTDLKHATFKGRCLAVIRAGKESGEVTITVSAKGVPDQKLTVQVVL